MVADASMSANATLAAALDRLGFWDIKTCLADASRSAPHPHQTRIRRFRHGFPTITDLALVEGLIGLPHDRGFANVALAGTADSSAFTFAWSERISCRGRELQAPCGSCCAAPPLRRLPCCC
jgi:hypothetical protein